MSTFRVEDEQKIMTTTRTEHKNIQWRRRRRRKGTMINLWDEEGKRCEMFFDDDFEREETARQLLILFVCSQCSIEEKKIERRQEGRRQETKKKNEEEEETFNGQQGQHDQKQHRHKLVDQVY